MAKPNGVIVLPPLYRPGGSAQYSDTIATDDTGTWNTYLMPDGTYSGIGFTLKAPSTAVLKLQASCNSLAEIQGDTTAGLAAAIAAGTFTGWTQAAVGSVVTFTAASTGLRSGVYDIGFTNGARGTMVLTNPGMTGVNATFLLTITQGASAPGNVGVALNGGSNVNTAVLLGDTAAQVATKIAASVFAGYVVTNPSFRRLRLRGAVYGYSRWPSDRRQYCDSQRHRRPGCCGAWNPGHRRSGSHSHPDDHRSFGLDRDG